MGIIRLYILLLRQYEHHYDIELSASDPPFCLCELLIVLRQQFQGDLDLMLILAIISSRAMPARQGQTTDMSYSQFISDQSKERADQPINIQSIAECSGIPRETVRRKVNKLEALDFIKRDAQGMLEVTDIAIHKLKPATEATLHYLIALGKGSSIVDA